MPKTPTFQDCIDAAMAVLDPTVDTPHLDAEVLLRHVAGVSRATLRAWPERTLREEDAAHFQELVRRRAAGEPVAYLVGEREFWSLPLKVTPDTLIPRPETELLVELALTRIPARIPWRVADLGTGTGAIALAIGHDRVLSRVVATDFSAGALAVAQQNADRLKLTNVTFRHGHWFEPLAGERFNLITSNPPYVATNDPHLLQGDVRFEPSSALMADADGLTHLRHIIEHAPNHLLRSGWLLLEHGWDQGPAVAALLHRRGFRSVAIHRDLGGQERISLGRWEAKTA